MLRADSEGRPRIGMPLAYARKRTWQAQGLPHHRRRTTWGGGAGGFAQCQEECTFALARRERHDLRSFFWAKEAVGDMLGAGQRAYLFQVYADLAAIGERKRGQATGMRRVELDIRG